MRKKNGNRIVSSVKKLFLVIVWILAGSGFLILLGAAIKKQNISVCKSIKINIDKSNGISFVNEKDILKLINNTEEVLIGNGITSIDITGLEKKIETNPFIENAEIFINTLSEITIEIEQKEPIVRVINKNGVDYYIDDNGNKMSLSSNFTARVLVATGNIPDSVSDERTINNLPIVNKIFVLAKYLKAHDFWNAMIQQIYVNKENEFELIPRMGNHSVLLGDIAELDEKMNKLMIFYKEGLNHIGWGNYEQINLKFKDQVICNR